MIQDVKQAKSEGDKWGTRTALFLFCLFFGFEFWAWDISIVNYLCFINISYIIIMLSGFPKTKQVHTWLSRDMNIYLFIYSCPEICRIYTKLFLWHVIAKHLTNMLLSFPFIRHPSDKWNRLNISINEWMNECWCLKYLHCSKLGLELISRYKVAKNIMTAFGNVDQFFCFVF